ATDVLMIQSDVTVLGVEVFDITGKKQLADNTRTNRININSLAQGTYVLAITTGNGVVRKPFIKN
ncbi:MAG TPA: T9SS type A sorting domain-containing protein, partial [Chitinophagales bacterium]|nr:T9SS type A sorting domain-containing protein [Chitinophagales bacterium]